MDPLQQVVDGHLVPDRDRDHVLGALGDQRRVLPQRFFECAGHFFERGFADIRQDHAALPVNRNFPGLSMRRKVCVSADDLGMKKLLNQSLIAFLALSFGFATLAAAAPMGGPAVYIAPADGFEVSIAAAFQKKQVPVQLVADPAFAEYVLIPSAVQTHSESGASKIARCLFAYCAGIEDSSNVSVQLVNQRTHRVLWAYQVAKQRASWNRQSMAEAIAKHFKHDMYASAR